MSTFGSYVADLLEGIRAGTREFFSPIVYLIKLFRKLMQ